MGLTMLSAFSIPRGEKKIAEFELSEDGKILMNKQDLSMLLGRRNKRNTQTDQLSE